MSEVAVSNLVEEKDKDVTKTDKTLHIKERNEYGLTQRQQKAAELLAAGKTKNVVAEEVGISRQQLWEWGKNVFFRSAVSRIHSDLWVENKQRLRGLGGKAVDVIATELDSGNLKAAVELLKLIGLSNGKIALAQQGKSVDDILEIDATQYIDEVMEKWDKPSNVEETLQRELGDRPWLIKDRVKIMRKVAVVPEDEEEEQRVT
jgi:hypothetical protein